MAVFLTYLQQYHLKLFFEMDKAIVVQDKVRMEMLGKMMRKEGLKPFEGECDDSCRMSSV